MNYVTAEELEGKADNKYEAVVVAALRARQLNEQKKKLKPPPAAESEAEPEEGDVELIGVEEDEEDKIKVTVTALSELIDGRISFEKHEE
jgi:DNA-directed RNA polymerase omega subunit